MTPEFARVQTEIDHALARFKEEESGIPFSMTSILKRIFEKCDNNPENILVYEKILEDIRTGVIADMRAFAKRVPAHLRMAEPDLRSAVLPDKSDSPPSEEAPKPPSPLRRW